MVDEQEDPSALPSAASSAWSSRAARRSATGQTGGGGTNDTSSSSSGQHAEHDLLAELETASTEDATASALSTLADRVDSLEAAEIATLSSVACSSGMLVRICDNLESPMGHQNALTILAILTTVAVNPRAHQVKNLLKRCEALDRVVPHLYSGIVRNVALACAVCANASANDAEVARIMQRNGSVARLRELTTCEIANIASAASGCLGNLSASQAEAAAMGHQRERDEAEKAAEELRNRLSGMATMAALSKASAAAEKAAALEVARAEASVEQAAALQAAKAEASRAMDAASELAAAVEKAKTEASLAVSSAVFAAKQEAVEERSALVEQIKEAVMARHRDELEDALRRSAEEHDGTVVAAGAASEGAAAARLAAVEVAKAEASAHAREALASAVSEAVAAAKSEARAELSQTVAAVSQEAARANAAALAEAKRTFADELKEVEEAAKAKMATAKATLQREHTAKEAGWTRERDELLKANAALEAQATRQSEAADERAREMGAMGAQFRTMREELERSRALVAELSAEREQLITLRQQQQQQQQQQAESAMPSPIKTTAGGLSLIESRSVGRIRPRSATVTSAVSREFSPTGETDPSSSARNADQATPVKQGAAAVAAAAAGPTPSPVGHATPNTNPSEPRQVTRKTLRHLHQTLRDSAQLSIGGAPSSSAASLSFADSPSMPPPSTPPKPFLGLQDESSSAGRVPATIPSATASAKPSRGWRNSDMILDEVNELSSSASLPKLLRRRPAAAKQDTLPSP